jgi:hypothetical protein
MRITITAAGGSPVTLCDHGREGPDSLTVTPIRKIDILEFVQGSFARPKNRGNTLNQTTFSVTKEHATLTAAQLYLFFIGASTPNVGDVEIELEDRSTRLVIREATVEVATQPLLGVRSTATYTLKFGRIDEVVELYDAAGAKLVTADGMQIFVNKEE